LWKIDPSSIDSIDGAFCHGVLDAQIEYNEEKRFERWYEKLYELEEYIKTNKKLPSSHDENTIIKTLAQWLHTQSRNYKKNWWIMTVIEINKTWREFIEEYNEYFKTHEEKWYDLLNELNDYINIRKKLPTSNIKTDIKTYRLGCWTNTQKQNYIKRIEIMKDEKIRKSWKDFTDKYREHFKTFEELWYENLDKLKVYIIQNNEIPKQSGKDKTILGSWYSNQKTNYRKNIKSMLNEKIRIDWEKFIEEYSEYTVSNKWYKTLDMVKKYIDYNKKLPSCTSKKNEIKSLGIWLSSYKQMKKNNKMKDEYIKPWENFIEDYSEYFKDNDKIWYETLNKVKKYIDTNKKLPSVYHKNTEEVIKLGRWVVSNKLKYKNNEEIMKQPEFIKAWEEFIEEYSEYFTITKTKKDMSKKEIKPMVKKETTEQKQQRVLPILSQLHKKYKTMNSQTLHKHFEDNPDDWINYHKISEENEETFPDEEIPYKKIIEYLDKIPGKKKKDVADLGCGKARVCEYFSDSDRFKFINMDHVSCSDIVMKQDIKDTGLDDYSMDIVVLSLAMWGSNCRDYITEANRILDENGVLLIIEATKRWTDEETGENKLLKLLEDNKFTIKNIEEEKFMFIECIKK
jgi:ribosomal RNA-processing protein 8